jgi:hypothetical protein
MSSFFDVEAASANMHPDVAGARGWRCLRLLQSRELIERVMRTTQHRDERVTISDDATA